MATRYFKRQDGHEVCTTSSGNRSKVQPGEPGYPYDWIEIDRKEFNKLRRQIVSGRTMRATDPPSALVGGGNSENSAGS